MADSSKDMQVMLLQNLIEVKAAELELKARQLKSIVLQNQARPMQEEEFKGEVSEILHQVGMIESPDYSVWKKYCDSPSMILHFESARAVPMPFFNAAQS